MPEYNAEWPTFTDYCKRLLDAKNMSYGYGGMII